MNNMMSKLQDLVCALSQWEDRSTSYAAPETVQDRARALVSATEAMGVDLGVSMSPVRLVQRAVRAWELEVDGARSIEEMAPSTWVLRSAEETLRTLQRAEAEAFVATAKACATLLAVKRDADVHVLSAKIRKQVQADIAARGEATKTAALEAAVARSNDDASDVVASSATEPS